jgi:hypothetical protein
MASDNPTGRGASVALTVPVDQARFLRGIFKAAREGVRDELTSFPEKLRDPSRLRCEEAAYGRLLAALDTGVIVPDRDVRDVLGDLARVIDAENEYGRVIVEHEALHGLLGQLTEWASR